MCVPLLLYEYRKYSTIRTLWDVTGCYRTLISCDCVNTFMKVALRKCYAGAFSVVVRDPLYPAQPLYDYDVGASCPVDFSVTFVVPTDSYDDYDKTLLVHIVDSYRTIKMTVFRPAPNHTQQTFGAFENVALFLPNARLY